jgi:hypothetical protein
MPVEGGKSGQEEVLIGRQTDFRPEPRNDVTQARAQAHRALILDTAIVDRQA